MEGLGGHVLLRAAQSTRDISVERIAEYPFDLFLILGMALDQTIEGRGRVEHHRPEFTSVFRV